MGRQILFNGTYFPIHSDIISRRINPWKAKLGGASLTFADFQNAELEEYHDFRNGIGKKRGLGSEARLDWSEGIDFTSEGQATLGGLVNTADYATWAANTAYSLLNFRIPTTPNTYVYECTTAGTSHASNEPTWPTVVGNTVADGTVTWTCRNYLAPIKIIDFQSNTYVIQNSRILKWDGTNLDGVDNTFASPIDAIVITDSTDEYLVVSSATDAIYTTDGTTWTDLATIRWKTPDSTTDPDSQWSNPANAIDDSTGTYAEDSSPGVAIGSLDFNLTNALWTDRARMWVNSDNTAAWTVSFYYDGAWNQVYSAVPAEGQWVTITNAAGFKLVSKVRLLPSGAGLSYVRIHEVDVLSPVFGYLADYENRLYCITTDGKAVSYSASKDIDASGGSFELTGNYGTLYDFFEGKLLADGTPTLYFIGTQGLFSLDTTNELAYKQEVAYPPLTYAGHVGKYWNANVWVATGYGILKVAPSVATFVGPDLDDGLPSGYQGNIYDMVTVNNWLVYCVNGGTSDKSSILKRNSSYGGNLQVYSTSAVNKPIACLHHSPSSLYTNGRLWFGEDTGVKYMMFPDTTSNVKQVSSYEYVNDSGRGDFPIFRKLATIPKTALGVAAIVKSCDATEKIEVLYGLNGAAPTTSLGNFTSSPKPTTLTFNSGLGTAFYTIQLAVKLYRDDTATNSPELESLLFYYFATPSKLLSWQFNVIAVGEFAQQTFDDFKTIEDTDLLVPFIPSGNPNKTSYNVKLTQMPTREWWEEQGAQEGQFTVVLEQVFVA